MPIERRRNVSNLFKKELELLIATAGYDKDKKSDLRLFLKKYGEFEIGISHVKIDWVLEENKIPREDFLYALASISVRVKGKEHYKNNHINNPLKYELERLLKMCDYSPSIGSVFPLTPKFKRHIKIQDEEKYLSSIPDMFWDLRIPFDEATNQLFSYSEDTDLFITTGVDLTINVGAYNIENNEDIVPFTNEESSRPDVIYYKLTNFKSKYAFEYIEVIRSLNVSIIKVLLLNGNWADFTVNLWNSYDYEALDLNMDNYYDSKELNYPDAFFYDVPEHPVNMGTLYGFFKSNPEYEKLHKALSYQRNKK